MKKKSCKKFTNKEDARNKTNIKRFYKDVAMQKKIQKIAQILQLRRKTFAGCSAETSPSERR
jgi:hypothetical protein